MQKLLVSVSLLLIVAAANAQQDSTPKTSPDTLRAGGFIIIKKEKEGSASEKKTFHKRFDLEFRTRYKTKNGNVRTNWLIFDLGFANWRDKTDYTGAQFSNQTTPGNYIRNIATSRNASNPVTQNSFNLRNIKSSNVNIWLFMQKVNVIKHVVNLKYGLGLEMYNYRFETDISYRNSPEPYLFMDSVGFSKNKLYASYITVPFMLNFTPSGYNRSKFTFSAGLSAGYLAGSRNKQISAERGKQKIRGNLNMEPWRLAAIGELGLGFVRVYGSYSLNSLQQKEKTGLEQYPYAIGVRFSTF